MTAFDPLLAAIDLQTHRGHRDLLVVGGIAFLGKILGQMREVQRQQALRQRVLEQQEKLPPVEPAPPASDAR